MSKRLPSLLIADMLDSIGKVQRYLEGMTFDQFIADERTVDAVVRNFEIIGEATAQLPASFKDAHPHIPWRDIADFRNVLIHEYFGVNLPTLWEIVEMNLDELRKQLSELAGTT